jgi:hypothetical protein
LTPVIVYLLGSKNAFEESSTAQSVKEPDIPRLSETVDEYPEADRLID